MHYCNFLLNLNFLHLNNMNDNKMSSIVKLAVWGKHIKDTLCGFCHVCDRVIYVDDYEVAPADPTIVNVTITGYRVLCRICYANRGVQNLDTVKSVLSLPFTKKSRTTTLLAIAARKKEFKEGIEKIQDLTSGEHQASKARMLPPPAQTNNGGGGASATQSADMIALMAAINAANATRAAVSVASTAINAATIANQSPAVPTISTSALLAKTK